MQLANSHEELNAEPQPETTKIKLFSYFQSDRALPEKIAELDMPLNSDGDLKFSVIKYRDRIFTNKVDGAMGLDHYFEVKVLNYYG